MRRASLVSFLATAVVTVVAPPASAASLPSGTITCQLEAPEIADYVRLSPHIDSTPGGRIILKATVGGTCDSSGVTGGKGPIGTIEAKLLGKLEAGTTCSTLVSAPDFGQVKLSLKWKGTIDDRVRTIATSKTHLVQGSWDDATESLVFTGEIFKGAFAGSTTSVRLTLDEGSLASLHLNCPRTEGFYYGADGESSITVP